MTDGPVRIGLTGSIGMGKSTVGEFLRDAGLAVWDADAAVHRLYEPQADGWEAIRMLLPEAATDEGVDRAVLTEKIKSDQAFLPKLETAIHPLVAADRAAFAAAATEWGIVFDIPLLFETGDPAEYHTVIVVSAPLEVQAERVLARPGMTQEKFELIRSRQMPDAEKRARADYVIDTGKPIDETRQDVKTLVQTIRQRFGHA